MAYSLGSDRCGSSEGEHFVHVKRLFSHKRGETCYVKMTLHSKSCRCPYLVWVLSLRDGEGTFTLRAWFPLTLTRSPNNR